MRKAYVADLFCGLGGLSQGFLEACQSIGVEAEMVAVNHWPKAIETHKANHPHARHFCESIELLTPRECVPGGHLDLLIAAPSCVHHSNARGGRPMNEQDRASAWCIMRWITELSVDRILIENVPEFRSWGPLGEDGRPIKRLKGTTFQAFVNGLRTMGYDVQYKVLNCADYGDPTTRKRFFLMASRVGAIEWPDQTHCDTAKLAADQLGISASLKPWVAAREIIDWTIPGKSIFNRKKPLAKKTLQRIYAGLQKFGGPNAEPFLIVLRQHMDAQGLDQPVPSVCASGQHLGLCEPFIVPQFGDAQPKAVSDPMGTITGTSRGIGVAQPVIVGRGGPEGSGRPQGIDEPLGTVLGETHRAIAEPCLIAYRGGEGPRSERTHSVDEPLRTQDTANRYGLAAPVLINMKGQSDGSDIDQPAPTQTTQPHQYLAEPVILPNEGFYRGNQARSVDDPLPTITQNGAGAVIEPFILPHHTFDMNGADSIDRPMRTIRASNGKDNGLVQPVIVPNFGEREGQEPRAHSIDAPLPAVTGHGAGALATPVIVEVAHGNGSEDPLAAASRRSQSIDEPLATVVASSSSKAVARPLLVQYNGTSDAQAVDEPVGTLTTKPRFALVMPDGQEYGIDIYLRMLKPHELAAAHSLPFYQLKGNVEDQVKMIGNSVPRKTGRALCMAALSNFDRGEPLMEDLAA